MPSYLPAEPAKAPGRACRVCIMRGCRMNLCRCCAATGGGRQPSACSARSAAAAARQRSKQTPPHLRRHLRSLHPQRPTASQSEAWSKVCAVHRIVCGSAGSHCLAASIRCVPYLDTFSHCMMHRDTPMACCDCAIIADLKSCLKLSMQSFLHSVGLCKVACSCCGI